MDLFILAGFQIEVKFFRKVLHLENCALDFLSFRRKMRIRELDMVDVDGDFRWLYP